MRHTINYAPVKLEGCWSASLFLHATIEKDAIMIAMTANRDKSRHRLTWFWLAAFYLICSNKTWLYRMEISVEEQRKQESASDRREQVLHCSSVSRLLVFVSKRPSDMASAIISLGRSIKLSLQILCFIQLLAMVEPSDLSESKDYMSGQVLRVAVFHVTIFNW